MLIETEKERMRRVHPDEAERQGTPLRNDGRQLALHPQRMGYRARRRVVANRVLRAERIQVRELRGICTGIESRGRRTMQGDRQHRDRQPRKGRGAVAPRERDHEIALRNELAIRAEP